jgi:hypothetical protein
MLQRVSCSIFGCGSLTLRFNSISKPKENVMGVVEHHTNRNNI